MKLLFGWFVGYINKQYVEIEPKIFGSMIKFEGWKLVALHAIGEEYVCKLILHWAVTDKNGVQIGEVSKYEPYFREYSKECWFGNGGNRVKAIEQFTKLVEYFYPDGNNECEYTPEMIDELFHASLVGKFW